MVKYDEKLPRREDFEDEEVYDRALEEFFDELDTGKPLSEELYKVYRKYWSNFHFIISEEFEIGGRGYSAVVLMLEDGEGPDKMNTEILLVAHEEN